MALGPKILNGIPESLEKKNSSADSRNMLNRGQI